MVVAVLDTGLATGGFDGIGHLALGTDIANGDNDPFDGDGWTVEDGDCDDNDPDVYPGRKEVGKWARDGIDNDCDGVIDK